MRQERTAFAKYQFYPNNAWAFSLIIEKQKKMYTLTEAFGRKIKNLVETLKTQFPGNKLGIGERFTVKLIMINHILTTKCVQEFQFLVSKLYNKAAFDCNENREINLMVIQIKKNESLAVFERKYLDHTEPCYLLIQDEFMNLKRSRDDFVNCVSEAYPNSLTEMG